MLLYLSEARSVYPNLAAEEYFLKETGADILMLWQSHSAVVCGKHQNLCAEVNYGYCRKHGIEPARRLSGGGTVYHDAGNVNFTFIRNLPEGMEKAVNFRMFLQPMADCLQALGASVEISSRNDLLLNGKKISGNAEHVDQKRKRVLHHGTLLFQSDLNHLRNALHSNGVYEDKAVKSVRSEVTNLNSVLNLSDAHELIQKIAAYWHAEHQAEQYVPDEVVSEKIAEIAAKKYATKEWITGYSPKYTCRRLIHGSKPETGISFLADSGNIVSAHATGDNPPAWLQQLMESIQGSALSESLSSSLAAKIGKGFGIETDPFILF